MQEFAKKILILFFLCLRITPYAVKINLELSEILRYFAPTKPIDHETNFYTWNEGGSIRRTYLSDDPLGTPGRGRLSAPLVPDLALEFSPIHTHIGVWAGVYRRIVCA